MAHADEDFRTWYAEFEDRLPILPDAIVVGPDTPAGTFGLAHFGGLRTCDPADGHLHFHGTTAEGCPFFSVREDFTLTRREAAHEAIHALEAVLWLRGIDPLAAYWQMRGFPGTWQEVHARAVATPGFAGWQLFPSESFAEAGAIVLADGYGEQTVNYALPLDVGRAAAFFESFGEEEVMDENEVRRIAAEVTEAKLSAYARAAGFTAEELRQAIERLEAATQTQPVLPHSHSGTVTVQ